MRRLYKIIFIKNIIFETKLDKHFELTNHLGNVLSVITDRKIYDGKRMRPDVIAYNDYYPFEGGAFKKQPVAVFSERAGMRQSVPTRYANADSYRYGFQGQEMDNEIKGVGNSLNYKYRMHDPRLGRFFAIDPLASKYPWNSPYAFSENMVINSNELEGLEGNVTIIDYYYDNTGKLLKVTNKKLEQEWGRYARDTYRDLMISLYNDDNVNWISGKSEYFEKYNESSLLNLWRCASLVCHDTKNHGDLILRQFHTGENVTKLAVYIPDYEAEALEKAIIDIFEGGITVIGGVVSEAESVGFTSSISYGAIVLGADQMISGARVIIDLKNGNFNPEEGTDRRPLRNAMITLFGTNGGKTYDLANVVYNLKKGVFIINKAPNEVLKYFNEISRVNSAVSVKDGVISITTNNNKKETANNTTEDAEKKDNKKAKDNE